MRILPDFKIPNFKFPKFKLKNLEELEVNEESIKSNKVKKEKSYVPTEYKTIKEIFKRSTELYKDKPFILEKFELKKPFKEITYNRFKEDVLGFGTGLNKMLNIKGKNIVIIGENTYYWYVSYMTLLCNDCVAVPVDKELPANEIENVVNKAKASVVIYSSKKKDVIDKIKENLNGVEYFIQMNNSEELVGKDVGIESVIKFGRYLVKAGDTTFMDIEVDPEEFKVLLFTSGTTSKAKGVMLCSRNLAENINAVSAYVHITEKDRFMSILPLHHTYESTIGFLIPMAVGASISICQGLKYIVPNLNETNPTILLAVPLLVESLYKKINEKIVKSKKDKLVNSMIHITNALSAVNVDIKRKVFADIHNNLGGNIKYIVSAAAPIDEKIGKWIENIGITFLQGYGLTETAPITALTPEFKTKVGSAGKAVICAEMKIDNPNENGEGEILIKSSTLMLGYYEDEEATNEVIQDGWFRSGDIGYLDNEGFLYITGRSKNVIVTQNGKNIYPEELELLISNIPEVKECMVYGKEEEDDKELTITAKIIPNYDYIKEKNGDNITDDDVYKMIWSQLKEINRKVTSYKAIKGLEIKKDEFEKTTTMKIKRFAEVEKDKKK